jgi:hypothetical protein
MENNAANCIFGVHEEETQIGGVHTWMGTLLPMLRQRGLPCSAALFLPGGEVWLTRQLQKFKSSGCGSQLYRRRIRSRNASSGTRGVKAIAILHSDDVFYRAIRVHSCARLC